MSALAQRDREGEYSCKRSERGAGVEQLNNYSSVLCMSSCIRGVFLSSVSNGCAVVLTCDSRTVDVERVIHVRIELTPAPGHLKIRSF